MGRPGEKKTGGRAKGTPNKNRKEIIEIVENKLGQDPLIEMCERYLDARGSVDDAQRADLLLKEINSYCRAKPRAVEVTGADGEPLQTAPPATPEQIAYYISVARGKA